MIPPEKQLNILIITHFYPPEMGAAAARISGLARWLVRFGHHVEVVTGFPNYPTGKIYAGYESKGFARKEEIKEGVVIHRTWVFASPRKSTLFRILNYVSFMVSSIVPMGQVKCKYDVIIASSPPLFVGISGWFLARKMRVPFIFDIRDIWPEVAVEAGEFPDNSMIVRLSRRVARLLYKQANHLTPVTASKMRKLIAQGVPPRKITVVSNGIDLDIIQQSISIRWREKLALQKKFTLIYAGLIGIAQGIDTLVEVARRLQHLANIHFLIVGDGVQRDRIYRRVQRLNLTNMTFLPSQPRRIIPSLLKSADLALVPLVNDKINDAIPSKLLEAWGCGKPVLLLAGGESAELVNSIAGGKVVSPNNISSIVDTIIELVNDRTNLKSYGKNGYRFVTSSCDRQKLGRIMESVLKMAIIKSGGV